MAVEPAPWISVEQLREFGSFSGQIDDARLQLLIQSATEVLYYHSAQQFNGGVTDVIRTCKSPSCLGLVFGNFPSDQAWGPGGPYPSVPYYDTCGCSQLAEVELPMGPIIRVNQILIDGMAFPQFAGSVQNWRIDDARWLVRLDGNPWPQCQFLDLPPTAVGTWQITYTYGRMPPEMGVLACLQLAGELSKAWLGERCQLPARATRVTRQGVSVQLVDIKVDEERTGLYNVDLFLRTTNPQGLRSEPWIWSPDIPSRGRRVTG